MILEEEELRKYAKAYQDESHYPCGEIESRTRAFIAGFKLADELHREENKHAGWERSERD